MSAPSLRYIASPIELREGGGRFFNGTFQDIETHFAKLPIVKDGQLNYQTCVIHLNFDF